MKKITSLFLILLFSIVTIAQTNNYNVGDIIDDFTVTDVYGIEHNLYEYADAGKHIYLDFFMIPVDLVKHGSQLLANFMINMAAMTVIW